jgi:hypothetical protein
MGLWLNPGKWWLNEAKAYAKHGYRFVLDRQKPYIMFCAVLKVAAMIHQTFWLYARHVTNMFMRTRQRQ